MERVAIISDLHGNTPAIESVLRDIDSRGIKRIICLGDLVGKGPKPDISIDIARERCEIVIRGNWDELVATRAAENPVFEWHQNRIGSDRTQYLSALPFSTEVILGGRLIRLVHASPQGVYHRVLPGAPPEIRESMFENTPLTGSRGGRAPDVVGYGDIHSAYVRYFDGKTLFNAGSVGNPLELAQASYAILEGGGSGGSLAIAIVRVPYDIERAVREARESGMPECEAYIHEITTARYRGRQKPLCPDSI